jgi:hypothetical protein
MKKMALALGLLAPAVAGAALAAEGPVPAGIPHLDHVFVIMMENHGYKQILNNPNAPFINKLAQAANLATNYFGVAHPSLTNYLEIVGGSNFGVLSDNSPDWHSTKCTANLASGIANTDNPPSPPVCPIWGKGTDAATPAVDFTNETKGPPGMNNIDGVTSIPAASNTFGMTIADQLDVQKRSWKSYQENLPVVGSPVAGFSGADKVNYSDGVFTNNTDFSKIKPALNPPLSQSNVVALYAVKHNPFAYFRSIQERHDAAGNFPNFAGFDGPHGLYADLATGSVPVFSFIAPNQCSDQHGRGNGGAFCNYDPGSDGKQSSMNPALMIAADTEVEKLVTAIHQSPVWHRGRSAIVVVWDENDFSLAPNTNQVVVIVDTSYGAHGVKSGARYTHFSLLKSIEGGLGLPCLNHACDKNVSVMADLFRLH